MSMIAEIDEQLKEWGAWVRTDNSNASKGTVLGRMIKRKQIENGDISFDVITVEQLNDTQMLIIDRAINTLPRKFIRLCKLRYIAGYGVIEVSSRMKVHRNTVRNMLDDIHARLDRRLSKIN